MVFLDGLHELAIVTLLAFLEYSIIVVMVGRARATYGVEAPATTGNPDFERCYRVQAKTLESLIVFIPAVWIFSLSVNYHLGIALGLLFVISRIIYAAGYLREASKRATGAILTAGINGILVLISLIWLIVKAL
jgi:glutathione S-transferase